MPHRLRLEWDDIVGPRIAARTCPKELRDGVLTVSVANSAWVNELTFLRDDLQQKIDQTLGPKAVSSIRFVVGSVKRDQPNPETPFAVEAPPAPPPPTSEELAQLRSHIERHTPAVPNDALHDAICRARVSQLVHRRRSSGKWRQPS